ncbi:hypothetical protein KSX_38980 [Ktedonospora formicarum]|uniref:PAS domain-containing protein n=1 Tax=Ktedonospora formicarum TaxID=2778364 RepID=A0A8J3I2R1_9CHLR|nr:hypothetical protein KSX_38980 [Ktedonospora formicarum]
MLRQEYFSGDSAHIGSSPSIALGNPSRALFVIDDTETIVYANTRAKVMARAISEACIGSVFWHSAPQLVSPELYQALRKTKQSREATAVTYRSPVTQHWLHVSLSCTEEGVVLFFQDDLESLSLLNALNPNEQMYRELLESLADGVVILTPDGLILDMNQRMLADVDLPREVVMGKPFADMPLWSYDPTLQEQVRAALARASRGENVRFEARIRPRGEKYLDILITITPIVTPISTSSTSSVQAGISPNASMLKTNCVS